MCRVGTHVPEPTSVCRVLRGFRAHRQRELVFYISAIANRPPRQKRVWRTLGEKTEYQLHLSENLVRTTSIVTPIQVPYFIE